MTPSPGVTGLPILAMRDVPWPGLGRFEFIEVS
jgi:hypothetical protein